MLEGIFTFPMARMIDATIFPQSAHTFSAGSTVVEPHQLGDTTRRVHYLKEGTSQPPSISLLEFQPTSDHLQTVENPLTLATIIAKLHDTHECSSLTLNVPLSWHNADQNTLDALTLSLENYQTVYAALELNYRAEAEEIPYYIATIPSENITGTSPLIPKVNAQALPPSFLPPTNTLVGFNSQSTAANSHQLLLQWGDSLVPSFSLLQLILLEDIALEEITIALGEFILLGDSGPILKLNEFGAYAGPKEILPAHALTPRSADYPWAKEAQFKPIVSLSANSETTLSSIENLGAIHAAPRTDFLTTYYRLPRWAELIVLADIAILFAWFLEFRPLKRHVYFILTLVTLWPVLVTLSSFRNMWMPASAAFTTAIVGWLVSFFFAPLVSMAKSSSDTSLEPATED